MSAVVSVSTSGVFVASTPAAVHAATSMLSKPTAWFATIFSCGPAASRNSASTRSVSIVMMASRPRDHLQELLARDAELVLVDRDVAALPQAAVGASMIGRVTRTSARSLMRTPPADDEGRSMRQRGVGW